MSEELVTDIGHLEEKYRKAPESRIFAPLADAYRKAGRVEEAIELCEKGLARYPEYASAHVILGKCFYDKGATERSRAEFEKVMELDPENMVALKFMGDILLAEGKRADAAGYYRKLLAIDPTNGSVEQTLKDLEEEFESREIDLSRKKGGPGGADSGELATMTLAGIYAAQGYYSKALRIYGEILEREPDNEEAAGMREKIEKLIEQPDPDEETPFDDEVMTISTEDVSGEIAESTAGHGTARRDRHEEREERTESRGPGGSDPSDDEEDIEEVARQLDMEEEGPGNGGAGEVREGSPEEPVEEKGGRVREGMDDFREWLLKKQQAEQNAEGDKED